MSYTIRANRSTVHIAGIEERTQSTGADNGSGVVPYYAESACGALTRSGLRMERLGEYDDIAEAIKNATYATYSISGRKVCKTCLAAAEVLAAEEAGIIEISDVDAETAMRPAHIPTDQWEAMTPDEQTAMGEWEVKMGRRPIRDLDASSVEVDAEQAREAYEAKQRRGNEIVAAEDLARNDRVVLDLDEMPYLVDSVVAGMRPNTLLVTFSSGDSKSYAPREPVVIRKS